MKRTERHKLKENEFARSVARAREALETRRRDITVALVVAIVALVAIGGYTWWRQRSEARANAQLAAALAIYEAPVVAPTEPKPGSPMPVQQPGTYQSERAKLEAALPKFLETADQHPGADAGVAARYHAASILAAIGRLGEAEQRYQEVIDKAGRNIYGQTARLGLADVQLAQGKHDNAISIYRELSADARTELPVDGILMQLGRAYARAGKKDDAARAFGRIVEEFPTSVYVSDARREMEEVKKG